MTCFMVGVDRHRPRPTVDKPTMLLCWLMSSLQGDNFVFLFGNKAVAVRTRQTRDIDPMLDQCWARSHLCEMKDVRVECLVQQHNIKVHDILALRGGSYDIYMKRYLPKAGVEPVRGSCCWCSL